MVQRQRGAAMAWEEQPAVTQKTVKIVFKQKIRANDEASKCQKASENNAEI